MLVDSFGRTVTSLRISVTDRCNLRCKYCMPEEGMQWLARNALLSYEEIARTVGVMASLGIRAIRLTGGEPLMRKELHVLVARLKRFSGIDDIALTTNGIFLKEQLPALVDAGLDRINISLDSVDAGTFEQVTRRDFSSKVWEGIEAAAQSRLNPVKLNVVLIRGVNDKEIMSFTQLARERKIVVRFIEFMPIGKDDGWSMDRVVSTDEVLATIGLHFPLTPVDLKDSPNAAERYRFVDGSGEIGFISSVSKPFCNHCNRIRITSDGKLRTCLFSLKETDLRGPLRSGASDEELAGMIISAVEKKEEGHLINQPGFVRPDRTMSQIGG